MSAEQLVDDTTAPDPTILWARLAPRLAARGRVRISRDGGKNYPLRYERPVTATRPSQPAAVRLYDTDGCAPVFAVDLDTSKAGSAARLERDYSAITGLLDRAGLRWFSDRSPNGGRHVYVPLAAPAPFHEAAAAAVQLAQRLPSVDAQPMRSIEAGCLRPPGAFHKSGGHQVLDGPLEAAEAVLDAPNDLDAWRRFLAELARHSTAALVAPARLPAGREPADAAPAALEPLPGFQEPSPDYLAIARTGDFSRSRYATPSEARQGVVWSAAAAGLELADVARRIDDGTWAGLASFYTRYRAPRKALAADWKAAVGFEKRRREANGKSLVRVRTTSPLKTQRGVANHLGPHAGGVGKERVNSWVREWLAAVDFLHGPETDLGTRAVLYALAEAAVLTGSITIEHGNRSLAIATGLDQSTVSRVLKKLAAAPTDRALVELVTPARRIYANRYELRVPALLAAAVSEKPWRKGRIHAIRPVFRELGLAAAFVYAALEQLDATGSGPADGRSIATLARVGVTATYEALQTLATHGLVDRVSPARGGGWQLGPASLSQLAEAWGIVEHVREQITRHRAERAAWRTWLVEQGLLSPSAAASTLRPIPPALTLVPQHGAGPPPARGGPPACAPRAGDDAIGLLELLERELGAQLIDAVS